MESSLSENADYNKVGAIEVHVSSAYSQKEKERETVRVKRDIENIQRSNPLENFKLNLAETEYKEPAEAIKSDLQKLYLSVGIDIEENSFPTIALYDVSKRKVVKACGGFYGGKAGFGDRVDIFPSGGSDLLTDIRFLHHEMNHHLGRQIVVSRMAEKRIWKFKWKEPDVRTTQLGFASHLYEGDERGLVLEEGAVEYFAIDFVLSSNNEAVSKARKNFVNASQIDKESLDDFAIRNICKDQLEKSTLPRYATSRLLVETLIEGARKIDEEEAVEMRKDILKTRIETKNMRSLMDRVDRIFGYGTFSKIYNMKFTGDETNEKENFCFVNDLRLKIGLDKQL